MTNVPYTFGNESSPIPLSQLDANFAVVPNYANSAGNVVNAVQTNITTVGTLTALSVAGNVNAGNVNTGGQLSAVGNVHGGNVLTGGLISAFGAITTNSNLTVGADVNIAGVVSAIGSVTAASFNTAGRASATGNVVGGNVTTIGQISAQGNILSQSQISATGNIVTAQYFVGNFLGNVTGNLSVGGSNTQVLFNQNGNVGAAGGLTYNAGSNVLTVLGVVSARGNVIAGNVVSLGDVSSTGNIVANSAQFTSVITAATPVSGAANNQVATTAFVNNKVGALGSMAFQNANSVAITGGTIGNTILNNANILNSSLSNVSIGNIAVVAGTVNNVNIANSAITNSTISNLAAPIAVGDGGTGVATLPQYGVLVGNGTSPVSTIAPGTSGNILSSNGTTWTSISAPAATVGLGFGGTTWHAVSRSFNTAYVNSFSYPIVVSATATCSVTSEIHAYVDGQLIQWFQWQFNGCGSYGGAFIIVPPGSTYQLNSGQGVYQWKELY